MDFLDCLKSHCLVGKPASGELTGFTVASLALVSISKVTSLGTQFNPLDTEHCTLKSGHSYLCLEIASLYYVLPPVVCFSILVFS